MYNEVSPSFYLVAKAVKKYRHTNNFKHIRIIFINSIQSIDECRVQECIHALLMIDHSIASWTQNIGNGMHTVV